MTSSTSSILLTEAVASNTESDAVSVFEYHERLKEAWGCEGPCPFCFAEEPCECGQVKVRRRAA